MKKLLILLALSAPAMAQQQAPRPHGNYQRGYPGDTIMLTYSDSRLAEKPNLAI